MKILCATDFSARARAAASLAIDLARRTAGSVELVHVAARPTADIQALTVDVGVFEQEIREAIRGKLAAEAAELGVGAPPAVSFHLGEGDAVKGLLSRADAIGADLIVMGAHGSAALKRWVLGSTAERTVRCADRPVLIVPPGFERWGADVAAGRVLRTLTALDGRRTSEGGIAFARQLRARLACDVTFLRLYWPPEEYQRLGLTGARDLAAPDSEVIADLERTLRTEVGVLPGTGKTTFVVEPAWGDPASAILAAVRLHDCDLLVMGTESRHGWARLAHPPIASQVAKQASRVPVVFVPPPAAAKLETDVPGIFTVLAPTDFSEAGNRAVPLAYAMVAAHGGVVELCHVHERALPNPPYAYDRPEGRLDAAERARIESALRGLVPVDAERLGITTHVNVIDGGHAAEAIVQAGERLVVDALVVGSHGKGGAIRARLGSVSQAVVRRSRRPVLVVPSPFATEAPKTEGDESP